ncbi:hypothetical protein, partial [Pseudomonas sp. N8]|uniref:hypothetical protein n=1 Tax=Pseudomonas sp. N8 TaxID=3449428 RepID=UPI003F697024
WCQVLGAFLCFFPLIFFLFNPLPLVQPRSHIFDLCCLDESGRKAAACGSRLPLFWHCRLAAARKAPVYGLCESGTALAKANVRTFWSPKGFRHEHQLR